MKEGEKQLFFDFGASSPKVEYSKRRVIQKTIAFLCQKFKIDTLGCDVKLGFKKYQSDIVALKRSKGSKNSFESIIIELYNNREECFNDCVNSHKFNLYFDELMRKKEALELIIRTNEPHLKDNDDLFDEFPTYDYLRSENVEYKKLLHELNDIQTRLNYGGRLENISINNVAHKLYLLVPEKLIVPDECAKKWGLIYYDNDLNFKIVKAAEIHSVDIKREQILIANIAVSLKKNLLFSHGIQLINANKEIKLLTPPRRRRKVLEIMKEEKNTR